MDGHVCEVPVNSSRRRWWTCDICGQLWHRAGAGATSWRMTERTADA